MQLALQDAFLLASRHDAAGRRAEARAIYEEILAALPEHPGALLKIAEQELQAGLHEAALARLERALRAAQQQSLPAHEIWLALGRVHLARGDRAQAARAVERALASPPDSAAVLARLGRVALDGGAPGLSERCFRAALARDPRATEALIGVALALVAQQRLDDARIAADAALALAPTALDGFQVLAYVARERGQHAEVQAVCRRGLVHHPRDVYLLLQLGDALRASGAAQAARQVL